MASSCHSIAGVFTQIPWLAASLESLESSSESFLNSLELRSNSGSSSESYSGSSSESYPGSNSTRTPARTPESFFESYASPHQAGCQAPRPGHPSAVLRSSEFSPTATSWTVVGGSDISYLPTSLPPWSGSPGHGVDPPGHGVDPPGHGVDPPGHGVDPPAMEWIPPAPGVTCFLQQHIDHNLYFSKPSWRRGMTPGAT